MTTKKAKINKKLDAAIAKIVEDCLSGDKLVRKETIDALKLAVQWEGVKARIRGDDEYGAAFAEFDPDKGDKGDAGNPDE